MKKRNNKVIILVLIGIIFVVSLVVFILNYSKDDSSFSILEKKWINDNTSNVIDVSVYNDVPVYGKEGNGVIFDFLDEFTEKYNINFNKVSYLVSNGTTDLRDVAFRVLDDNVKLSDNDILLYNDYYVLLSTEEQSIDRITDIDNITIAVLSSDISMASNYLADAKSASYEPYDSVDDIEEAMKNNDCAYALLPYNMNIDFILENDLHILFHLTDIAKKYVLTINDNSLLNIMKKYYLQYSKDSQDASYKENFLDEFFSSKGISEAERTTYNSNGYVVGYITYMPFESKEESDFVGTLSNYLSGFEDLYDVNFKLTKYGSIEELRQGLSSGEVDLAFANFNTDNLNIDTIYTPSIFKEEYVVLSKTPFVVNSIKSLEEKEALMVKNSYIHDYAMSNAVNCITYDDTDELLRNVSSDSIIIIDKDTYNYYKNKKFGDYNILYTGVLPYEYHFVIRDVNKNSIFAEMFSYYVSTINYEEIRYEYNTNANVYDFNILTAFLITGVTVLAVVVIIFIYKRKKNKKNIIHNNDKLKYIDAMTSLKNRTYLNYKIKEWDDNVIYPQAFVVVDLNNIKYINDNHGHEEGDNVIKKAASILIVNQEANTDIIRTDGNEFLIYMVGYDEKAVVAYTRKIYKELKELPYNFGAAIGYSMIMDDVKTIEDAINEATIDMRNKKENL